MALTIRFGRMAFIFGPSHKEDHKWRLSKNWQVLIYISAIDVYGAYIHQDTFLKF